MQACTPDYIATLQKQQDLKFWRIYDSTGKVEMNRMLEEMDLDRSIELLQEDLSNTYEGFVIVRLYSKKPISRKEGDSYDAPITRKVKLGKLNTPSYNTGYTGPDNSKEIFDLRLKLERMLWEKEHETKASSNNLEKFINLIEEKPHVINTVISGIGSLINMNRRKPKIAAPVKATEGNPDKFTVTLNRLAGADPDYMDTLDKLADLAESDPAFVPMLKMKLASMDTENNNSNG